MNNQGIPSSAAVVTPSDTTSQRGLGLYVGGAGNIAVRMAGTNQAVTLVGVIAGTMIPMEFTQVLATGTTATNLVRFW